MSLSLVFPLKWWITVDPYYCFSVRDPIHLDKIRPCSHDAGIFFKIITGRPPVHTMPIWEYLKTVCLPVSNKNRSFTGIVWTLVNPKQSRTGTWWMVPFSNQFRWSKWLQIWYRDMFYDLIGHIKIWGKSIVIWIIIFWWRHMQTTNKLIWVI